ncbi:MAG: PHP domain-containing protein, partial [Limnochordales bacterium]
MTDGFVHLHVHSPFSFLDGASAIDELVQHAADLEMPALALTDHDNLSGAVRFVQACTAAGIKPIIGCELTLAGGWHLTALATSPKGYANLCRIVSAAHLHSPRGQPRAAWDDLIRCREDLLFLAGCRRSEVPALLYQ